jgi:DNA-binding winged helix-turn-helix (wHTH) protein/TolB-like protein
MNFLDRTILPRIDLAREADFSVGALRVRPSRREIEGGGVRLELQRRVMQVLVALAHPSAEVVSQDELISRCWGGLAVGEDAVSRCIGQLRRVAQQWPEPPFEIVTIAGVGYRLVPAASAAPDDAGPPTGASRSPKLVVIAAAGAGAVVLLAAAALWLGHAVQTAKAPPSRIAILPFEPVSSSPAEHAFATGLADELQSVLSASSLQVVSREDAATLRGPGQADRLRQLGVRLLLDGTVATDHDTLHARVHLDDPGRHVTLWSAELSGPASNPDALEAQVGARAIAVLTCAGKALGPHKGLSDADALSLYLHACDLFEDKSGIDDVQTAYGVLDALRQVAARAPGFAPAHSALARFLAYYSWLLPDPAAHAEADREARSALAIDPKDSDAYVALSMIRPVSDYGGRERLLQEALAIDPAGAFANTIKANLLLDVGRFKEAEGFLERAVAANPVSLDATTDVLHVANGQWAAGDMELDRLHRLWPRSGEVWVQRWRIYGMEDRWDDVLAVLDDRGSRPKGFTEPEMEMFRTDALAQKLRTPAAVSRARLQLPKVPVRMPWAADRVLLLYRLGLVDDAFQLADRWAQGGMTRPSAPAFLFYPGVAPMRRDPRFMALAARLGLVDYWRSTGKWPDFCAEPGLPYDCKKEAERLAARGGGR